MAAPLVALASFDVAGLVLAHTSAVEASLLARLVPALSIALVAAAASAIAAGDGGAVAFRGEDAALGACCGGGWLLLPGLGTAGDTVAVTVAFLLVLVLVAGAFAERLGGPRMTSTRLAGLLVAGAVVSLLSITGDDGELARAVGNVGRLAAAAAAGTLLARQLDADWWAAAICFPIARRTSGACTRTTG